MTTTPVLSVTRKPIQAVIDDHGALPVLLAALRALFTRKAREPRLVVTDLRRLDNWLRDDIGLPPQEVRSVFPIRSP